MKQNRKVKMFEGNGYPMRSVKPNRNEPCKYGSGKKQKYCCGVEAKYFHSRPPKEKETSQTEIKPAK